MTNEYSYTFSNLHHKMLSGAIASLSLTQEIGKELISVSIDGISTGDEKRLARVGVFVIRNFAEHRFGQMRRKVATYVGERKALIEAGNRLLRDRGAEAVAMQVDYGLSECRADTDTGYTNTEWSERMGDAYERMQVSIEAVEADISKCQDLLGESV